MHKSKRFNLLDEPWIPIISDGKTAKIGLIDLFRNLDTIDEVQDPSPLTTVALHRLLLAILYRNLKPQTLEDWVELHSKPWNSVTVLKYLKNHHDSFWLFHPERPFMQRIEIANEKPSSLSKLQLERSTGNNSQLFDHSADDATIAMDFGAAACAVVTTQCWAVGGGKSGGGRPNSTHGHQLLGATLLSRGPDLWKTLLLNLVPMEFLGDTPRNFFRQSQDLPTWEQPLQGWPEKRPILGISDWLTWQCRGLLLIEPPAKIDQAFEVIVVQGESIVDSPLIDPWMAYTQDDKEGWRNRRINPEKAAWRDSESLFAMYRQEGAKSNSSVPLIAYQALHSEFPECAGSLTVDVIGMANDKAKLLLWRHERFRLPAKFFTDESAYDRLRQALETAQLADKCLHLALRLYAEEFLTMGNRSPDTKDLSNHIRAISRKESYWAALESCFHRFLQQIMEEDSMNIWKADVVSSIERAFGDSINSCDTSPRHLRAATKARGYFNGLLYKNHLKEAKQHAESTA
ncbi:MAG: type I-E CRISPR-associated protein Cse1/CasA [Candidatus Sumerlaeia bacterium]|nr:type I-E CRISPR-associated protein Cse1/CasA [Candidatus Sumerlaeia bacterium]